MQFIDDSSISHWILTVLLLMEEKKKENEIRIYNSLPESKSMNFQFPFDLSKHNIVCC